MKDELQTAVATVRYIVQHKTQRGDVHVGMEPSQTSQTRWEWHCNTFTPSLHLVPFCRLCTAQNSLHLLNEHYTQPCSLHSLPHKRQSISAAFSSNKISQHNLKLPTYPTHPALLTVSAYKTNYTCHATNHNIMHSPCTSTCMLYIPSNTFPTAFHNPHMRTTNKQWHKM